MKIIKGLPLMAITKLSNNMSDLLKVPSKSIYKSDVGFVLSSIS